MRRVIGNINECVWKNTLLRDFMNWLRQFDGCEFTAQEWNDFKLKVIAERDKRNAAWKTRKNLISVTFSKKDIFVCCQDSDHGNHSRQMTIEVIKICKRYDMKRCQSAPAAHDSYDDQFEEEGGCHE